MGNVSACSGIYDMYLRYSQYVDNFVVVFVSHTNEIHNFGALLGQRYLSVVAPCVLSRWGDGNGERQRQRQRQRQMQPTNVVCELFWLKRIKPHRTADVSHTH